MEEKKQVLVGYDTSTIELLCEMDKIREEKGLRRINSVMLLQALLEEKNSILYDCICATLEVNPYKQIILDCNIFLSKLSKRQKNEPQEIDLEEENTIVCCFIEGSIEDEVTSEVEDEPLDETFEENLRTFYITDNVKNVISNACDLVFENETLNKGEEPSYILISSEDIFVEFMADIPKSALTILKNNGVYNEAIRDYYLYLVEQSALEYEDDEEEIGNKTKKIALPATISDFVTDISSKYKDIERSEILGREKECKKVFRILEKRGKKNVVLIGEPGVGKTSIVERIAFDIAKGDCPEDLKGNTVLSLNVNSSIAGTKYRGMAEDRFKELVKFLEKNPNVILFIDEIHMVLGAGATARNDKNDMANALKPFLASPNAKVIGATTEEEYEICFRKDEAFKRRFQKVVVKEPKSKEVYSMLKNAIEEHEKYHGVKISKEMVEYAILISSCFNNTTKNPDRTNDLIDSSMVIAKEQGKEYVDKDCILANFDINFDKFEKLNEDKKKSTAYHEAGHYLVWRMSGRLEDLKGIAVSIMPAEDYLGITVYDDLSDEVTIYPDRNYYIDHIAKFLAGRVAENMYTKTISSGASVDLEIANKMARKLICNFGMTKEGTNRVYSENSQVSEKLFNSIDDQVKEVIEEATKRAKDIIEQNEFLLEKLVDALMEKSILDENDLDEIFAS